MLKNTLKTKFLTILLTVQIIKASAKDVVRTFQQQPRETQQIGQTTKNLGLPDKTFRLQRETLPGNLQLCATLQANPSGNGNQKDNGGGQDGKGEKGKEDEKDEKDEEGDGNGDGDDENNSIEPPKKIHKGLLLSKKRTMLKFLQKHRLPNAGIIYQSCVNKLIQYIQTHKRKEIEKQNSDRRKRRFDFADAGQTNKEISHIKAIVSKINKIYKVHIHIEDREINNQGIYLLDDNSTIANMMLKKIRGNITIPKNWQQPRINLSTIQAYQALFITKYVLKKYTTTNNDHSIEDVYQPDTSLTTNNKRKYLSIITKDNTYNDSNKINDAEINKTFEASVRNFIQTMMSSNFTDNQNMISMILQLAQGLTQEQGQPGITPQTLSHDELLIFNPTYKNNYDHLRKHFSNVTILKGNEIGKTKALTPDEQFAYQLALYQEWENMPISFTTEYKKNILATYYHDLSYHQLPKGEINLAMHKLIQGTKQILCTTDLTETLNPITHSHHQ